MLIFPETNSLELVRAITGGGLPLDDIIALEQEALAETGNIILNGCLATIANILQRTLRFSLPEIIHGSGSEIFGRAPVSHRLIRRYCFCTLIFRFDIVISTAISHMLMDLPSLTALKMLIGKMIERATGESTPNHAAH